MSKPDLTKMIEAEKEEMIKDLERQAQSLLHIINFLESSPKFNQHNDFFYDNQRILEEYNQEYTEVQNKINYYRQPDSLIVRRQIWER